MRFRCRCLLMMPRTALIIFPLALMAVWICEGFKCSVLNRAWHATETLTVMPANYPWRSSQDFWLVLMAVREGEVICPY